MLQALFFQEVNDHGFIFVYAKYNNILNPTASIKFCKNIILQYFTDLWKNIPFYNENPYCIMLVNRPRDTKSFLTLLTRGVKPCRLLGKSFTKNIPATTRVWSKISCGDEWTSSQAFSYFLCIFSGKTFFLFN